MDPRNAKRPRSSTPASKGGSDARKKKKRNKKSSKTSGEMGGGGGTDASQQQQEKHRDRPHHKETATADGSIMSQMISTFSSQEQSRFQAFKRATFRADAVENWIAACLQDRYHDKSATSSSSLLEDQERPLEDLVAMGQAQDIGLVVAIAAKIYAQRLVAEALAIRDKEQQQQQQQQQQQSTASTSTTNTNVPLSPTAVWKAVQARRKRGVDPGFFLQPASGDLNFTSTTATAFDVRRLAAQHAQAQYDQQVVAQQTDDKEMNVDDDNDDSNDSKPVAKS